MFSKFHIAREGISLCHAREGILIPFGDAAMMNPAKCCEDCRLRFRNITGIDIRKIPINKALLREKTKINKTLSYEWKKPGKSIASHINTRYKPNKTGTRSRKVKACEKPRRVENALSDS